MEKIAKLIFESFFVPHFFIFSSLNVYFYVLYFNYAIFMFAVFIIYLNVYICGLLFTLAEMWYIGTPYLPLQQINNKVHQ